MLSAGIPSVTCNGGVKRPPPLPAAYSDNLSVPWRQASGRIWALSLGF